LVDKHATHCRIRSLSAGIFANEKPVGATTEIDWPAQEWELKKLGLDLNAATNP
ncbi:MAG: hypothetical protein JWR15_663, partial [Prosthecobacter sp.]|nr:hypothetical protein [Prosthecobacter sp.]